MRMRNRRRNGSRRRSGSRSRHRSRDQALELRDVVRRGQQLAERRQRLVACRRAARRHRPPCELAIRTRRVTVNRARGIDQQGRHRAVAQRRDQCGPLAEMLVQRVDRERADAAPTGRDRRRVAHATTAREQRRDIEPVDQRIARRAQLDQRITARRQLIREQPEHRLRSRTDRRRRGRDPGARVVPGEHDLHRAPCPRTRRAQAGLERRRHRCPVGPHDRGGGERRDRCGTHRLDDSRLGRLRGAWRGVNRRRVERDRGSLDSELVAGAR